MASASRHKTSYPGVFFIESTVPGTNQPDRIYYIRYRRQGRLVEEKAGRQSTDDMTPARASRRRLERMEGKQESNSQQRAAKAAEANRWTIARLWEHYKHDKPMNKALDTDDKRFQKYILSAIGGKVPRELAPLDLDRIRIKLGKTLAPQTVKHVLGIVKRICSFGFKKGLCPALSFQPEMPRVDNKKTEDLTHEQLHRLLFVLETDENRQVATMMKMALFTGMRRGELCKLRWDDIDFHRGFIFIRDPKGGSSQKIPMSESARRTLEEHERNASPFVFPNRDGKQRDSAQKAARRIKKMAGLPKDFRPFHGLRHTYASMLASSGKVDMYTLQKLMTHKTPVMTQRYAHLRDEALQQAAEVAGDIITQAMKPETGRDKKVQSIR